MNTSAWIRRLPLLALLSLVAAPHASIASSDSGTLTVGHAPSSSWPCFLHTGFLISGYSESAPLGSYSPTGLTGGTTVAGLFDVVSCPMASGGAQLQVSGFASNPGSAWLTSVKCGAVTKLPGAASFGYSSGAAIWTWSTTTFGFTADSPGANVSCTIVHD